MATIQTELSIATRAEAYKLLSLLYKEPVEELSIYSQLLSETLKTVNEDCGFICESMKISLADESKGIDDYLIEYSRLFVGPFKLFAPPYSSIYLEDKWVVMGKSTQAVEEFYSRAGLTFVANSVQPADHISLQFEFMYYLNFKLQETGEFMYLELQKEFLYKILIHWIPKFNAAIQDHAMLEFYQYLGNVTEKFIQLDYASL